MAQQEIDLGSPGVAGDLNSAAWAKTQSNFDEIYNGDALLVGANLKTLLAVGVDSNPVGTGGKVRVRCSPSPAGGHFYWMVGDDSGASAMFTNGYFLINGNAGLDGVFPNPIFVAGETAYMFGIYTDIGASPMVVLKGDTGDFIRGYNGSDVLTFKVQINGGAQFGGLPFPSDPPIVWVGTNIASTAAVKIGEGHVKSYYGAEANPRVELTNDGSLTFITDGAATAAATGVAFKIVSDRVAAIATSNGTALTNRLIVNGTGEIFIGAINGQSLVLTTAQRLNFANAMASRNLSGVDGADTYKTLTTGSAGYSGIEQMFGGDVAFYATSAATTADAVVTPTDRLRIKGDTGHVGVNESDPDYMLDVNGAIGFSPGASVTPVDNGDVVFELTNNTTLTIKAKGSDGTVRSAMIALS